MVKYQYILKTRLYNRKIKYLEYVYHVDENSTHKKPVRSPIHCIDIGAVRCRNSFRRDGLRVARKTRGREKRPQTGKVDDTR